ncbi:MAG: FAD-binding protein [bacterium]|nr:FAD-binding protein [bacterium]
MKDSAFLATHGVKVNEPLAPYTKIRTGGNVDFFAEARNRKTLTALLSAARENGLPVTVIGCGSRIICSDHGYRGLVIRYSADGFLLSEGEVEVDAGFPVHALIGRLAEEERGGLEAFAGYPGSLGGAIAEGATRGTIRLADMASKIMLVSGGRRVGIDPGDLRYGVRGAARLNGGQEWVQGVRLRLVRREPEEIRRRVVEATRDRLRYEPAGKPFAFVFRDPPRQRAADLLAKAGMGGEPEGGALVSAKNPNAIINDDGATAQDVYRLAQRMNARVQRQTGAKLLDSLVWLGER